VPNAPEHRRPAPADHPPAPAPAPDLDRFAQAQAPVYDAVRAEIAAGDKRSHWMWFVFPQLRALGRSATARHFGLADAAEARAYLGHPVLGPRLRECCALLLAVRGRTLHRIFGSPDDLKLRSCMTLFEAAAPQEPVFAAVLDRYCDGVRDPLTRDALDPR
jgi:uncharacterized protein (DUF1810 family)